MRSLTISITALLLIICLWFGFMTYTENLLSEFNVTITEVIIPSIQVQHWDAASDDFKNLTDNWHASKQIFDLFLDNDAMVETDFTIAKAEAYIAAQDTSSALGELFCIKEQFRYLFENERITIENLL